MRPVIVRLAATERVFERQAPTTVPLRGINGVGSRLRLRPTGPPRPDTAPTIRARHGEARAERGRGRRRGSFTHSSGPSSTSVRYTSGSVTSSTSETITATPTVIDAVNLVVASTSAAGSNTASRTPTLDVTMPAGALVGPYRCGLGPQSADRDEGLVEGTDRLRGGEIAQAVRRTPGGRSGGTVVTPRRCRGRAGLPRRRRRWWRSSPAPPVAGIGCWSPTAQAVVAGWSAPRVRTGASHPSKAGPSGSPRSA